MKPLNKFVVKHYGSQKSLAESLGVAEHTISRWMKREPAQMMRHAFAMSEGKPNKERKRFIADLAAAIMDQIETMNQN
jgi:IS30 family transposase